MAQNQTFVSDRQRIAGSQAQAQATNSLATMLPAQAKAHMQNNGGAGFPAVRESLAELAELVALLQERVAELEKSSTSEALSS